MSDIIVYSFTIYVHVLFVNSTPDKETSVYPNFTVHTRLTIKQGLTNNELY